MDTSKVAPNTVNQSFPRGRLSFAALDDTGVSKGEIDIGNCTSLQVHYAPTYKEHMTSHDSQVFLDRKPISDLKCTVKFSAEERSKENMALALLGDPDKQKGASPDLFSQSGADVSGQDAVIYLDRWIQLKNSAETADVKYIKPDSIIIHNGGTTTLSEMTAGTWRMDYETGRFMILSTNDEGLTDGLAVTVDFTYGTCSLPLFKVRTVPLIGYLHYVGLSEVGPRHEIKFWKVQLVCDSPIDFIKPTDIAPLPFSGDVYKDDDSGAHTTEPFFEKVELSEALSYPS